MRHTEIIVLPPFTGDCSKNPGPSVESISRGLSQEFSRQSSDRSQQYPDDVLRVDWQFWKISQSQYHYRDAGEVDLRDLS